MAESDSAKSGGADSGDSSGPDKLVQHFQHAPVSARVPEKLARGAFAAGVIIIDGPFEFVLDFVLGLVHPKQVVSRVVMSPGVVEQFIIALRDNIGKYEARFGPIPALPKPPQPPKPPTIQEIYDELKISEDQQSGAYANAVMIAHGPSEFSFDFITRFFPTAAVSARVFMAAPQVPRMLESMTVSLNRYKQRLAGQQPPAPPVPPDAGPQTKPEGGPQN